MKTSNTIIFFSLCTATFGQIKDSIRWADLLPVDSISEIKISDQTFLLEGHLAGNKIFSKVYSKNNVITEAFFYDSLHVEISYDGGGIMLKSIRIVTPDDPDGLNMSFYDGNRIKYYHKTWPDTLGNYTVYYSDGSIREQLAYSKEDSTGYLRMYNAGRLTYYAEIKSGKRSGVELDFFNDGTLKHQCHYNSGFLHGDKFYYNREGAMTLKEHYVNGKLIKSEIQE